MIYDKYTSMSMRMKLKLLHFSIFLRGKHFFFVFLPSKVLMVFFTLISSSSYTPFLLFSFVDLFGLIWFGLDILFVFRLSLEISCTKTKKNYFYYFICFHRIEYEIIIFVFLYLFYLLMCRVLGFISKMNWIVFEKKNIKFWDKYLIVQFIIFRFVSIPFYFYLMPIFLFKLIFFLSCRLWMWSWRCEWEIYLFFLLNVIWPC